VVSDIHRFKKSFSIKKSEHMKMNVGTCRHIKFRSHKVNLANETSQISVCGTKFQDELPTT